MPTTGPFQQSGGSVVLGSSGDHDVSGSVGSKNQNQNDGSTNNTAGGGISRVATNYNGVAVVGMAANSKAPWGENCKRHKQDSQISGGTGVSDNHHHSFGHQ